MPKFNKAKFFNQKQLSIDSQKDKPVLSDEQIKGLLDEKGNPLYINENKPSDTLETDVSQAIFLIEYVSFDMNGDNVTDISDIIITSNNASLFVAKVTP